MRCAKERLPISEKPSKSAVELVATDAEESKKMLKAARAKKPKPLINNKNKFKKRKGKGKKKPT